VMDLSGNHPELKILGTNASKFFLLDLRARTSAPFLTAGGVSMTASKEGDRTWVYLLGSTELSVVDLEDLHPAQMHVDRAIAGVFEIAATDGNDPGDARSLVIWHNDGSGGVTVYDAGAAGTAATVDDRSN
jgi:hypothetical protein